MGTNKELLAKGVKTLAFTLMFLFMAPFVLNQAFKNQGHPLFVPVLILGIILAGLAIFYGFKGINIIMKSIFGER